MIYQPISGFLPWPFCRRYCNNAFTNYDKIMMRHTSHGFQTSSMRAGIAGKTSVTAMCNFCRGISMIISQEKMIVLHRMQKGTKFLLRGDKAMGHEVRQDIKTRKPREVNCRCLAPLIRDGLVEFVFYPTDITRYYEVRLTEAGQRLIKEEINYRPG